MGLPVLPRPVRIGAALTVALAILLAAVRRPGTAGPPFVLLGVGGDKWLHALGYASLAATVAYARLPAGRRGLAAVVALAIGHGLLVELLQAPLVYRSASPPDLVADAVGAVLGTVGWAVLARTGLAPTVGPPGD